MPSKRFNNLPKGTRLLEPTIFMESIQPQSISDPIYLISELKIKNTVGKLIDVNGKKGILNKTINRHNAFVTHHIPEAYFGKIKNYIYNFKKIHRNIKTA